MKLGSLRKTVEIRDAKFYYKLPWGAKQAFIELATSVADSLSPEDKAKIRAATEAGQDPEIDTSKLGDLDIARAVRILLENKCLVGWEGVTYETESGEEKPLEFSHDNAKTYLDGETLIEIAMDALQKTMQSGN